MPRTYARLSSPLTRASSVFCRGRAGCFYVASDLEVLSVRANLLLASATAFAIVECETPTKLGNLAIYLAGARPRTFPDFGATSPSHMSSITTADRSAIARSTTEPISSNIFSGRTPI